MNAFATQLLGSKAIALACVAITVVVYAIRWYIDPLRAIPTIDSTHLPGLSYLTARYAPPDFKAILRDGCRRYPDSAFKAALRPDQWVVIVSRRHMVEDLVKRPDSELSARLGREEARYSYEAPVLSDPYHLRLVKEKFTRILPNILPDVVEEISVALSEYVAATENAWTSIHVMPALRNIVAQSSNRAFVGLPLCRNQDYFAQAIDFAGHIVANAMTLLLVPTFMRPLAALFLRKVRHHTDLAVLHLRPIIEKRTKAMAELGDGWSEKPNDMLQFILDKAAPKGESPTVIVQRLMVLSATAIGTTVRTATQVLYRLAEQPALLAPLRAEIEANIAMDGWTAAALGRMWKLDSVLRETLRHHGHLVIMYRKALQDLILPDGTRVPRGTLVAAANHPAHLGDDDAHLEGGDASAFDAFRYARMHNDSATKGLRYRCTSTSPEYLSFGHGAHACPGRYFAAAELKVLLGHIVLEYDLKLDGVRPADVYHGTSVSPAPDGRVLFRKRARQTTAAGSCYA